ncbi:MAG: RNA methyltransferase, partial [Propionibacterium sp.]|nr:RNA methyltransferase [Propionibacterium sp.]
MTSDPTAPTVGVGPHPEPWPDDERYDPELLRDGDRRNVLDEYRYWKLEAIVADLDERRAPLHVAIQNWEHDFNIGSMVRTANAFNVAAVHIVGKRRWNRRGAMVTDRYLHVHHHDDEASLFAHLAERGVTAVGIDNLPGSVPLETTELPRATCLVFGSEGPGLTDAMVAGCERLVAITQYG